MGVLLMGSWAAVKDGFINVLTGSGTARDPRSYNRYAFTPLSANDIDAAYRGSVWMRKIIDKPATEMVREWRDWQADADQIEKIETVERTLDLRNKVRRAEVLRGLGGAGMVLWIEGEDQTQPIDPMRVRAGSLKAINVCHRSRFALGPMVTDWSDPWFGHPAWYEVRLDGTSGTTQNLRFHPSRVVAFRGQQVADITGCGWEDQFWGDSRVQTVMDAVQNVDESQNAFAAMLKDARNRRIGISNLTDIVASGEGETMMTKRIAAFALGESLYGASFYDSGNGEGKGGEVIEDRQMTWTGIPEIMSAFLAAAAGAADMPATVLLGKSPDGMNATGAGDLAVWEQTVKARQDLDLRPCLDQIDAALIPSALGKVDPGIWWEFAPLSTPTEAVEATTFNTFMDAVTKLQATGSVQHEDLSQAVRNEVAERAWLKIDPSIKEEEVEDPLPGEDDPSALQAVPPAAE